MSLINKIRLDGKRALVTGAGRGIGKGCAIELARCGADVIVNDRPGNNDLETTADQIRALGRKCWTAPCDVFEPDACRSLVEDAIEQAGAIDILVSNPAFGKRESILKIAGDDFDKIVDATFKSGFHVSQAVAQHMVGRGCGGKIVFISSVHACMPVERNAPYGAAKAALNHLAQTMSVELFSKQINVNVIEPGWIDTPGERLTFSDAMIRESATMLPWGRIGVPEDIGLAAAFLASPAADYITAAILPVDGGYRFKDMRAESQPTEAVQE